MLMGEKEIYKMVPCDTTEGNRRKSYSEVVIEGATRIARVFVGDSVVRKTDKAINIGDDLSACFPGTKIEDLIERFGENPGSWQGRVNSGACTNK